jgi:hypothetical protein
MESEMIGFCMHCGKALRESGHLLTPSRRLVCNVFCKDLLILQEQALEQIRTKASQGSKYSGLMCYAAGVVFLLFGIPHLFLHNILFWLGIFLSGIGLILLVTGYFYVKVAQSK